MLLTHTLAYLVARGLPGLLSLLALVVYTRLLEPGDYGRYALAMAGISMASVLVFQWQRLVVARWLAKRHEDAGRFLGETLSLFGLLAVGTGLAGLAVAWTWPDAETRSLVLLAVPTLLAFSWMELNLVLAASQLAPRRYGWMLGARSLVALALGGGLAYAGFGALGPLVGILAGCLIAAPAFGRAGWRGVQPAWPGIREVRGQLRYGLPLIATFALGWVLASSDRFLIGWLLDVEAAGRYAVGYDLAQQSLGVVLAIVNTAAYPLAVRALEERGRAAATEQLRLNAELVLTLAFGSAAAFAVLAPEIASLVVGPEYRAAVTELMPWIAVAGALGGIKAFHFDQAFHLGRRSDGLVITGAVATLVNLGLNLLLIPAMGLLGAALATVIAFLVGILLSARLGSGVFEMPPVMSILGRACVLAGGVVLGGLLGKSIGSGHWSLVFGSIGAGCGALAAAFMLDVAGFRQFLQARLGGSSKRAGARQGGQPGPDGRRPRLAIWIPSMRGGGAERVMALLANGIAERGIDVDLVLAAAEGPYLRQLSEAVRVVDLRAGRLITALPGLVRYLSRARPDAMLSAMNHANVVAVLARGFGSPATRLVLSEHDTLSVSVANSRIRRVRWLPRLMRWVYPKADLVVAVSSGVAQDLSTAIGLPRDRIRVIYNPAVTPELVRLSQDPVSHAWFDDTNVPVFLAVGRLAPQKNFDVLIRAFGRLRSRRDARLLILGEGALRRELVELVNSLGLASDVDLPGFVDNPFAYMRRASAFVLSSRWEGLGVALIEAMACGTAVVSTDCPNGPAEILENGAWGRLVPVGDVDAMAEAMIATLDERSPPDVAQRAQDFSVEPAVDAYLAAFDFARTPTDRVDE